MPLKEFQSVSNTPRKINTIPKDINSAPLNRKTIPKSKKNLNFNQTIDFIFKNASEKASIATVNNKTVKEPLSRKNKKKIKINSEDFWKTLSKLCQTGTSYISQRHLKLSSSCHESLLSETKGGNNTFKTYKDSLLESPSRVLSPKLQKISVSQKKRNQTAFEQVLRDLKKGVSQVSPASDSFSCPLKDVIPTQKNEEIEITKAPWLKKLEVVELNEMEEQISSKRIKLGNTRSNLCGKQTSQMPPHYKPFPNLQIIQLNLDSPDRETENELLKTNQKSPSKMTNKEMSTRLDKFITYVQYPIGNCSLQKKRTDLNNRNSTFNKLSGVSVNLPFGEPCSETSASCESIHDSNRINENVPRQDLSQDFPNYVEPKPARRLLDVQKKHMYDISSISASDIPVKIEKNIIITKSIGSDIFVSAEDTRRSKENFTSKDLTAVSPVLFKESSLQYMSDPTLDIPRTSATVKVPLFSQETDFKKISSHSTGTLHNKGLSQNSPDLFTPTAISRNFIASQRKHNSDIPTISASDIPKYAEDMKIPYLPFSASASQNVSSPNKKHERGCSNLRTDSSKTNENSSKTNVSIATSVQFKKKLSSSKRLVSANAKTSVSNDSSAEMSQTPDLPFCAYSCQRIASQKNKCKEFSLNPPSYHNSDNIFRKDLCQTSPVFFIKESSQDLFPLQKKHTTDTSSVTALDFPKKEDDAFGKIYSCKNASTGFNKKMSNIPLDSPFFIRDSQSDSKKSESNDIVRKKQDNSLSIHASRNTTKIDICFSKGDSKHTREGTFEKESLLYPSINSYQMTNVSYSTDKEISHISSVLHPKSTPFNQERNIDQYSNINQNDTQYNRYFLNIHEGMTQDSTQSFQDVTQSKFINKQLGYKENTPKSRVACSGDEITIFSENPLPFGNYQSPLEDQLLAQSGFNNHISKKKDQFLDESSQLNLTQNMTKQKSRTEKKTKRIMENLLQDDTVYQILTETYEKYHKLHTKENRMENLFQKLTRDKMVNESQKKSYVKKYKKGLGKIFKLKRTKKTKNPDESQILQQNYEDVLRSLTQDFVDMNTQKSGATSYVSTSSSYKTDNTASEILSTGSADLTSPQKKLRRGFNEISQDKSLLYSENGLETSNNYTKKQIREKIQQVLLNVYDDMKNDRKCVLKYRRQTMDNCVFQYGR